MEGSTERDYRQQRGGKVLYSGCLKLLFELGMFREFLCLPLRSSLILDQWRKKAELFKSRAVLIPLGDDFRYNTKREWQRQLTNYEKIMAEINGKPQRYNAEVQWATLEDYFSALRQESQVAKVRAQPS